MNNDANRPNIGQMRQEMARLAGVMMERNNAYLIRWDELVEKHGHDDGALQVRVRDDIILNNKGDAARTCGILATAIAAVIQAEIAYVEHHNKSQAIPFGPRR